VEWIGCDRLLDNITDEFPMFFIISVDGTGDVSFARVILL